MKVSCCLLSVSPLNRGSNQVRKRLRDRPLKYNRNRVKAAKRYMKMERGEVNSASHAKEIILLRQRQRLYGDGVQLCSKVLAE